MIIREGSTVRANNLRLGSGAGANEGRLTVEGEDIDGVQSDITISNTASLGDGEMKVLDGAHANFLDLNIGEGGQTQVEVSGASFLDPNLPARLNADKIRVGMEDFATLIVQTGGLVDCNELSITSLATSGIGRLVVIDGIVDIDSMMRVSGDFQAGESVIIENQGTVSTGALRLGDESTSDAAEIVVRNGTQAAAAALLVLNGNSAGECQIGADGPGILRLENFATVAVTGAARIGGSAGGGEGLVEIIADSAFNADDLFVGGASPGTIKLLTDTSRLNVGTSAIVNAGGRIELKESAHSLARAS